MSIYPVKTLLATTGIVLTGTVIYAASKSETLRPAFVGVVRTGLKAADWTSEKYNSAKEHMKDLVAEAKAPKVEEVKSEAAPVAEKAKKAAATKKA